MKKIKGKGLKEKREVTEQFGTPMHYVKKLPSIFSMLEKIQKSFSKEKE